MTADIIKVIV